VAKQPIYPFAFTSAYSQEAGEYFSVADANGLIPNARLLRSAWDDWRAKHRWLMSQGHSALNASLYLLSQSENSQPQAAPPQPAPMPSPFGQAPMGVAANGR
jgi:hypothetical protein